MKRRSLVAAAHIGVMCQLALGIKAEAAELTVLSAFGMQSVLEDLGPKFERATGHPIQTTTSSRPT
jgi:ABC-type molybdate transport system substrate-binding protein